jgi:chemotaxis response regulator CheB
MIKSDAELRSMRANTFGKDFPIVCVGGSAGGLDAYTRLLKHLPADMGVAIVIVNHLRTVATQLHEILPRYTEMPVELITERLLIRPNHVFIIPAQRDLHVLGREFHLTSISKPRDGRMSSRFFCVLSPNTGAANSSPSLSPAMMATGQKRCAA